MRTILILHKKKAEHINKKYIPYKNTRPWASTLYIDHTIADRQISCIQQTPQLPSSDICIARTFHWNRTNICRHCNFRMPEHEPPAPLPRSCLTSALAASMFATLHSGLKLYDVQTEAQGWRKCRCCLSSV